MHVLTIIRKYLGMSQSALAKAAALSQPDLCDMETKEPYGRIEKYCRVANVLGLPLEPIIKNDIGSIPLSFFDEHASQPYIKAPKKKESLIGREGEDYIFAREQERLREILPVHARLVLPLYKMKNQRIGCDILSYNDIGEPIYLEVKTTVGSSSSFSITDNERKVANSLTKAGKQYIIVHITDWNSAEMRVQDIPYLDLLDNYNVSAHHYYCTPKDDRGIEVSGLAYYRYQRRLKEREVAEVLEIPEYEWCLYETRARKPPVKVLLAASELFDVTVDQLLDTCAGKE